MVVKLILSGEDTFSDCAASLRNVGTFKTINRFTVEIFVFTND